MVPARCDVVVFGGGVCGLWTLHGLLAAGYDAWLLERSALGDGQTIASQGILHAGAKYRLPGNAVDASKAVADVQPVWRSALAGGGDGVPDLSRVRVIDRRTVLWTTPGLGSRLAARGAAGVLRSGVRKLGRGELPGVFAGAPGGVEVYATEECVLEPASLVGALAGGVAERVRLLDGDVPVRVDGAHASCVSASAVVLAAGGGNEALIASYGGGPGLMQRRPVHQIVAIGAPFDLNGHCLQLSLDKPALTVTTGELHGERTWYLGGGPAEEGVARPRGAQIEAARAALARCLPWVDLSGMRFETFLIDRVEGFNHGKRPDDAVAVWAADRVLAVWPTKLVLAPRAAGLVVDRLRARGIEPTGVGDNERLGSLPKPGVAPRVW